MKRALLLGLVLLFGCQEEATTQEAAPPKYYTLHSMSRIFDNVGYCEDAYNALGSAEASQRLTNEVDAGAYHDLPAGTQVQVTDSSPGAVWGDYLFVIVETKDGISGCMSKYHIAGYQ